jgi:diguanylate cyclase (GGDEF)-like protein
VGILIADVLGNLVDGNDALRELSDAEPSGEEELSEWPDLHAFHAESGEPLSLRALLTEHSIRRGETILSKMVDLRTPAGFRKSILYSSVPITGAEGEVIGGVAVLNDVTRQRQLEQQAQQRADELEGLHRATAALLSTLDLDELLCQILDAAQSAIPSSEKGMLHLISPVTGQLQVRATLGFSDERICVIHSPEEPGLPARVARDRRPLLVTDALHPSNRLEASRIPDEMKDARSIILAPLYYAEHVLGTLSLSALPPNAFTESNLRLLASFAATTTAALQNAILHAEIKHLAVTDPLTGEYNRRAFFDIGMRELDRYLRFNHPLTAVMVDLDNFKQINDTYGHVVGDQIIRNLAVRCKASIRDTDIFGRYGGDEFALLLPDTELPTAQVIAQRFRETVERGPWTSDLGDVPVSISMGIAQARKHHRVLEDLLADADTALYLAKSRGRNRVEIMESEQ